MTLSALNLPIQPYTSLIRPKHERPVQVAVPQQASGAGAAPRDSLAAAFGKAVERLSNPASASGRLWGSEASGVRHEIMVNGEVVGRVYNGGAVELADEYGYLAGELGWGGASESTLQGPDLADQRTGQILAALSSVGATSRQSATALTQKDWLAQFGDAIGTRVDGTA